MLDRFKLFRSIEVFARILCAKAGVSVRFKGTTASTNGKCLWLPSFSKVLDDLALAKILYLGFVVHECFHILWTDFNHLETYLTKRNKRKKGILNILEDVRIEYRGVNWIVGFRSALMELVKALVQRGDFFGPSDPTDSTERLCKAHLLYSLRSGVLGQSSLHNLSTQAREMLLERIGDQYLASIDELASLAHLVASTSEICDLTDRIYLILDELDSSQNEDPQNKPNSSSSPPDPSTDGAESDDTDSNSNSTQPGKKDDDDNQGNSVPNDSGVASDDEVTDEQGGTKPSSSDDSSQPDDSDLDDSWDLGDVVSRAINGSEDDQAQAKKEMTSVDQHMPTVIGSTPVERIANSRHTSAISNARSMTNSLSFQLRSLLEAKKTVRRGRKDSGTRIAQSSLSRVALGDYRVFRSTSRTTGYSTAVYVVLDVSSSMNDRLDGSPGRGPSKLSVARESVLALALALESISDVKVGVMAYPQAVIDSNTGQLHQYMHDLVEIGESISLRSNAIMTVGARGSTPTAEAILYARAKMEGEADRKVILVLTDGEADNESRLAEALAEVSLDTDVIGIGIGTSSVSSVFENHVVISDAKDLTKIAFKKIREVLIAA
jgi:cobaltochelatase CobT